MGAEFALGGAHNRELVQIERNLEEFATREYAVQAPSRTKSPKWIGKRLIIRNGGYAYHMTDDANAEVEATSVDAGRGEVRVRSEDLAQLASAAGQMAVQFRQIKILVFVYAVASLLIGAGSTAYFAISTSLLDGNEHDHESSAARSEDGSGPVALSRGDPLPRINLADAEGRVWSSRDLEGKAVLLNFWATWCAPCRREMPLFDEMQRRYEAHGFTVMAVSVDQEGWNVVRPYIDGLKPNYPVFVADESITREFGGINTLPTTYFVRRNGTIHAKHVGELSRSHMIQDIEALLRAGIGPESDESGKEGGAPSDRGTESITSSTTAAPGSPADMLSKRTVEAGSGAFHGIVPPRILQRVVPEPPEGFGATIPEGFVELEARIGEDGNAYDIQVARSLRADLDERAVEALRHWRFSPGTKDGKPVQSKMKLRLRFNKSGHQ